jgi:endonuclease YncB( thermonuclease family)
MTRRRLIVFAAAVALLAAACGGGDAGSTTTTTTVAGTLRSTTTTTAAPTTVAGDGIELVRVLDGDSLIVTQNGEELEVRLLGLNAPEATACHGPEAEAALADLLAGRDLSLLADPAVDTDQYGRLLRYVFAGGELINETLITEGHAMALHVEHDRESSFLVANETAFEAQRGMWAPDACGPIEAFGAGISFADVNYNPPGPDEDNPNGEWVTIENRDDTGLDLTGWTVRDESSTHRFVFPEFGLDAGRSLVIYVGCGEDAGNEFYWCAGGSVWNNGGDTALLLDSSGNVVARYSYDGDY